MACCYIIIFRIYILSNEHNPEFKIHTQKAFLLLNSPPPNKTNLFTASYFTLRMLWLLFSLYTYGDTNSLLVYKNPLQILYFVHMLHFW